jgi:hypothetical protein
LLFAGPAVAGIAAHLDSWIKQPIPGSIWLLIRKPLSLLAGNYGWAKNADQETLAEWWAANSQAFINWLVKCAGDALKDEIAKAALPAQKPNTAAAQPPAPQPDPAATAASEKQEY